MLRFLKFLSILSFILAISTPLVQGSSLLKGDRNVKSLLRSNSSAAKSMDLLIFELKSGMRFSENLPLSGNGAGKNPGKALFLSALLPGAGQFYAGAKIRGLIFLAGELSGWTGYGVYYSRGNNMEKEFKNFADMYWDYRVYLEWKNERYAASDTVGFTHQIDLDPNGNPIKSDEYYENIGKYEQFLVGWRDFDPADYNKSDINSVPVSDLLHKTTSLREKYTLKRKKSNDYFRTAKYFISAVMLNHIFSALDAVWTVKRMKMSGVKTSLRVVPLINGDEIVQSIKLSFKW
ncbi:MAG: hypothetical protein ACE5QV_08775 [Fidelibacterota bacterium]